MTREIDPTPRRRARRYIEPLTLVLGLVTAAAAIIVPLYVFSASEQHAVLTVRYTASQALVNVDPRSANNVRVTYEGSEVRIPWLLSLRVENTGDKPIDSKDIKDNLSITFPQAQILRAQLTEKHPKEISSKIDINTNTLSVVFDLLNPQDNLSFDALLNGEPWNASTSFRMIGKYALVEVPFTQKPSQPFVTWPRVSSDVQVWILVFATGALAILFSFSLGIIGASLSDVFAFRNHPSRIVRTSLRVIRQFEQNPVSYSSPTAERPDKNFNIVLAAMEEPFQQRWINEPAELTARIAERVPSQILSALNLDPETAAKALIDAKRPNLVSGLAHQLWLALPIGVDQAVRTKIWILISHWRTQ